MVQRGQWSRVGLTLLFLLLALCVACSAYHKDDPCERKCARFEECGQYGPNCAGNCQEQAVCVNHCASMPECIAECEADCAENATCEELAATSGVDSDYQKCMVIFCLECSN